MKFVVSFLIVFILSIITGVLFFYDWQSKASVRKTMTEVFPISDIETGISIKKLKKIHLNKNFVKQLNNIEPFEKIGVGVKIESNKFWYDCTFQIEENKLAYIYYRRDYFFDMFEYVHDQWDKDDVANAMKTAKGNWREVKQTAQLLLEHLKQLLGTEFERKIMGGQQAYVWKQKKDVVVFTYRPLDRWEEYGYSYYLYIFPSEEELKKHFFVVEDSRPEDAKLWLDLDELGRLLP